MDTTPEQTLTRRLARNLDGHFEELVVVYQQPLFAFALRNLGSFPDAEEVVQDVFVRAYRALESYDPARRRALTLRPWLFRICVNLSYNKRRRPRLLETPLDGHEAPALSGSYDPVAEAYAEREGDLEMMGLLAQLPKPIRVAVVLRHVNDLSYSEIATILDLPEGTVKSHVHRGLKNLRLRLESARSENQLITMQTLQGPSPAVLSPLGES